MKSIARGFSLVELMIVVAIISILVGVALPAYQDYTVRTRVSEVILAMSGCRTTVTEIYQGGGTPPGGDNWGCETATGSKHVEAIATSADGKVLATIRNIHAAVDGKVLTMTPLVADDTPAQTAADMGKPLYGWRCGASADGTDVDSRYLPGSCRGG
jgi:type IV pilus assembly protein PilA